MALVNHYHAPSSEPKPVLLLTLGASLLFLLIFAFYYISSQRFRSFYHDFMIPPTISVAPFFFTFMILASFFNTRAHSVTGTSWDGRIGDEENPAAPAIANPPVTIPAMVHRAFATQASNVTESPVLPAIAHQLDLLRGYE